MSKTNEQLLLDYKRTNKERRLKIVEKAGFSSEAEYLSFLMTDKVGLAGKLFKKNDVVKPTIHNVHILDVSGSMSGGKLTNAIQGINSEISELKTDDTIIYTQTLVEFSGSHDIRTILYKVPIKDVKHYNTSARGMTALNQALGETLTTLKNANKPEDKVLVKVFTDGGENASQGQWADSKNLSELIKECEANGFTVTFVGTQQDVATVINTLHVDATNTMSHDNTERGVSMAFAASLSATKEYRTKLMRKEDVSKGFYKTINEKK